MSNTNHTETTESSAAALRAPEVAELLGISDRHMWKLHAAAQLPAPVRLGRSVRWRRAELLDWLAAGAPSREVWDAMTGGDNARKS
jgi:excisionase family DNA binding protein